ncbi:MAG TPA: IS110 family transposase [Nitrospiraceae bacterium]|jgi:transposase|nr:IS110 family transposase [Nitrospiraceae bacterium]
MNTQNFVPREFDIFGGLDVDKKSIAVTFMSHQGTLQSFSMPSRAEQLLNYVGKHFAEKRVAFAYEAGPTGWGLYDRLTAGGHLCLVAAPSMIPKVPGQRVKTNRLDSHKLSEHLRGGQLKSVHVPTGSYRQLRQLVQLRDTFVQDLVATKLRIKAMLLFEGLEFPPAPAGSQWSLIVRGKLKRLSCSSAVRFKLDQLMESLESTETRVLKTIQETRRFYRQDPELSQAMALLKSIPGIGEIVASHLLARIGDPQQIGNVRQLAGFIGLVPTERSTGDRVARGPITRSGDGRLRSKLIQAAWSAIRQDPELRQFYRSVYQRHPRDRAARKAIVAVARKLTTRIYAVLKQQRPYVVREIVHSAPLTQEETSPQGTTRRLRETGDILS